MQKFLTITTAMLALTLTGAAAGAALAHDEDAVSKTYDMSGFDSITIAGVYELDVRVGSDFSVALSGPAYEMDRVEVSVKDGALVLDQRKRSKGGKNRNHRDGVEAVITLPSLTGLNVSGVVDGKIAGVDADQFKVKISGVGDVSIGGECGALEANLSGVGELNAKELVCRSADVSVSGVGSATVFASEEADARVSGMGEIDIYGSPENVTKSKGMFADITVH